MHTFHRGLHYFASTNSYVSLFLRSSHTTSLALLCFWQKDLNFLLLGFTNGSSWLLQRLENSTNCACSSGFSHSIYFCTQLFHISPGKSTGTSSLWSPRPAEAPQPDSPYTSLSWCQAPKPGTVFDSVFSLMPMSYSAGNLSSSTLSK